MAPRLPERADVFGCGRTHGVGQKLVAALGFIRLTDRIGRFSQAQKRPQEPLIWLVIYRNRAMPAPSGPAQCVQAAVVTGARKRISSYAVTLAERAFCQHRPRKRGSRQVLGYLLGSLPGGQRIKNGHIGMVIRKQSRIWARKKVPGHAPIMAPMSDKRRTGDA